MQDNDLLEAAFCCGFEPSNESLSLEQLMNEATNWITDLSGE